MNARVCAIEECERPARRREWCGAHHQRWLRWGDPLGSAPKAAPRVCSIDECGKPYVARGWCSAHWNRWRSHGDPLGGGRTPEPRGDSCSVTDCISPVQGRGWCNRHLKRWQNHGDPLYTTRRAPGTTCSAEGCDRSARESGAARGWCRLHYQRFEVDSWLQWTRRRARLRNAFVEAFEREEIFERDGWICGLCNDPIDPALSYPDPLSASLDHVIPLALGGEHSRANAQAAHLTCNRRKGARVAA